MQIVNKKDLVRNYQPGVEGNCFCEYREYVRNPAIRTSIKTTPTVVNT